MSPSPSPQYSLSEADSNVEGGTPRSGSKPPLGSRTVRRSTGNLATILASKGVRNNKRQSPSAAGKESGDNSAEEKNRTPNTAPGENNKKIERPTKPRPFDPLTLGTLKKTTATKKKNPATEGTKARAKELGIRLSITKPGAQSGTALSEAELQQKIRAKEYALSVGLRREKEFAAQRAARLGAGIAGAAVKTAEASMNSKLRNVIQESQLIVKKAKNSERAKTAEVIAKTKQKEANLHKYAGRWDRVTALVTQIQKDLQKSKKEGKNLSDAMVKKNKQIALATKKMEEIMTKAGKRDNFSKKNILDFISKSAKSNNKLTKKDILEFLSKQKTPTVTVKQSIGNVKAEGGKANVQISNSKKLNREARLDQNIKRRDANYRRVVTTDPMVLKRQKRVFAKKRGELLKSIQKIIKSDRKTSPKIKKKVYDSYVKSPRDRISKLLKLPKKELITMIKRSTSRISK